MPRIHARNRAEKLHRILFERMGIFKMRAADVAKATGKSDPTARGYLEHPERMRLGDLIDFCNLTGMTDEEFLQIRHC